jgi:hypothetical protein
VSVETDPILIYLPWAHKDDRNRHWQTSTRITEQFSEGYPTGNLSLTGLRWDDLRAFADWALGLPPELYVHVKDMHRTVERALGMKRMV